ncbi:Myb DNA-bind domain-containing protein [Salix suchowensis]|nr:Myb DNA-bind domain-containing protein [Salix suchowensis]
MDNSGLRVPFLSGSSGGLIDHESPIHRHQQSQLGHPSLAHQHQMNVMGCSDNDYQPIGLMEMKGSALKVYLVSFGEGRAARPFNGAHCGDGSEDDDRSFMEDGNGENCIGAKDEKGSPRQRMKWTDNVVRVLMQWLIGLKRKSGLLQRNGKWKTVSMLIIGKGCHVSPQQCEDKFECVGHLCERKVDEEHPHLCSQSGRQNSFDVGMTATFEDPNVSPWERKEWIKKQRLQLLEQRVNIKAQAFELEKQQFKWSRYCSKKDKEFERSRLLNERTTLEIRQSALQLKQKQLEMDKIFEFKSVVIFVKV